MTTTAAVIVPPRFETVSFDTHVRLTEMLGDIDPANFDFTLHCALSKGRQGLHGQFKLKQGCILCSDLLVRGDISTASVDFGKFVVVGESVLIRPTVTTDGDRTEARPVSIGEHVFIGQTTVIESTRIGSCVVIESNCILGPGTEVHHGVWIKANSVVPRDAKLTPFGVYQGNPAKLVGHLHPDSGLVEIRELVLDVIRRTGLLAPE